MSSLSQLYGQQNTGVLQTLTVTSSQTFTCPCTQLYMITVVGGGGGGAATVNYGRQYGGGAGGATQSIVKLTKNPVLSVTLGGGGAGASSYASGSAGGASSISGTGLTTMTAGGGGGGVYTGTTPGTAGAGGVGSGGTVFNLTGPVGTLGQGSNGTPGAAIQYFQSGIISNASWYLAVSAIQDVGAGTGGKGNQTSNAYSVGGTAGQAGTVIIQFLYT